MARHSDSLSLEELGTHASRLLSPGGVLDVILPVAHALTFTAIATENDLHCHRVCEVRPTPTSRPKRRLLEFSNHLPEQDVCEQEMVKLDGKKSSSCKSNIAGTLGPRRRAGMEESTTTSADGRRPAGLRQRQADSVRAETVRASGIEAVATAPSL